MGCKDYYALTKPGIIYGNSLTVLGGYLLAAQARPRLTHLLATLAGVGLVIACGCVVNNYIDRGIDRHMARTRQRALAAGKVLPWQALVYAAFLGVAGFVLLAIFTNALTVALGIIGLFDYVVLYGLSKRRSKYGTLVGSISGAMPIVAGYTAASGRLDAAALLLGLTLVAWQMTHFYAIALFRQRDYAAAGLPVWPLQKGARSTQWQMLLYTVACMATVAGLTLLHYTGYTFLVAMELVLAYWLATVLRGFRPADVVQTARRVFFTSLLVITIFSISLATIAQLP